MRALVFGARGQLGADVARAAAARGMDVVALGREEVDASDARAVADAVRDARPALVVNCVAHTNVDSAEDEPAAAFAANATAARNVAKAARGADARLVHASTSYVFDGEGAPYGEDDAPRPLGVYAASKLAGEHLTLAEHPRALVVRLVTLFGPHGSRSKAGGNFVELFATRAKEGQPLRVIADQWIAPSYTPHVAEAMLDLASAPDASGIVNVQNEGRCSWHDVAVLVALRVGAKELPTPIPGAEWPRKARRPRDTTMRTDRFAKLVGRRLPPWQEGVEEYLRLRGLT